jgi:hypothetical protein
MKKRKLVLNKETIRPLDANALGAAVGGSYRILPGTFFGCHVVGPIGPASIPAAACATGTPGTGGGPSLSGQG